MILTPRFLLRALTPADATKRYSSWLDEEMASDFIAGSKRPHGVDDLRAYIEEKTGRDDVLFLGIFTRDTNEHIGNIKYEPIDREKSYAVMGILIGDAAWRGRGVAAEVIRTSGIWLCDHFGIKDIILGVSRKNRAAIKAYEKAGFIPETEGRLRTDLTENLAMVWRVDTDKTT
ncbi:MAG: GNAT family N-acetyltransferase [Betaproteobacteria bacterium]|nr:GNAT family N-acetyltransferase [Betaproteobacteria bacterium]